MKLYWAPYDLELRHTFTISGFSRNTTPVVLTRIECEGLRATARHHCRLIWEKRRPRSSNF